MVTEDTKPFHRRSIRLKAYDYSSPGAYFITLVTREHRCLFGIIVDQIMVANELGRIVQRCWLKIPAHFPGVEIEPFMVMPNHLHGIITINEHESRGTIYRAPTFEKFGRPTSGSIPTIIRTYKAAVSCRARRELGIVSVWQRNYYEHIIRNEPEMNSIASYISTNPANWPSDPEYIS